MEEWFDKVDVVERVASFCSTVDVFAMLLVCKVWSTIGDAAFTRAKAEYIYLFDMVTSHELPSMRECLLH